MVTLGRTQGSSASENLVFAVSTDEHLQASVMGQHSSLPGGEPGAAPGAGAGAGTGVGAGVGGQRMGRGLRAAGLRAGCQGASVLLAPEPRVVGLLHLAVKDQGV